MQPQDDIPDIDVSLDDQPAPRPTHSNSPHRLNKKGGGKRFKIVAIILAAAVVLAGAGFAVYWFVIKNDPAVQQNTQSTDQTSAATEEVQSTMDPKEASKIKTFNSEKLGLEFNHRTDWTVKEADDGNSLTVTSPSISYKTINGTVPEGNGVFTLRIAKGVNSAQKDTINSAVAVQKSDVIAYAKPTEEQRHYTAISYGGAENAFTFLMVTGAVEFNKDDTWANKLVLSSADYYLIAGGFGEDPDDSLAFDQVSASQIGSETVKQVVAIIESMRIF